MAQFSRLVGIDRFDQSTSEVMYQAEAAACKLVIDVMCSFGAVRIRATGSSMLPTIWPGDTLVAERRQIEEVKLGEIVLFSCYGRLVAHRVISKHGTYLVTQGDTVPQPDPPVSSSDVLGAVAEIIRCGKSFAPKPSLSLSGKMTAALVRRSSFSNRMLQRTYAMRRRALRYQER